MLGFEVGITREITKDTKADHYKVSVLEKFPVPSEGMSVEEMILGYTINGATQLGMADRKGSIEVGKDADYVVFNEDLFSVCSIIPNVNNSLKTLNNQQNGHMYFNFS